VAWTLNLNISHEENCYAFFFILTLIHNTLYTHHDKNNGNEGDHHDQSGYFYDIHRYRYK